MMKKKSKQLNRGTGILMPVSSLPGKYGIGTMGRQAYEFVDFVKEMGFRYWQVLPVGPTSFGDSPYQSFSAFAGNPYFIDLDCLKEEGLLTSEEIEAYDWGTTPDDIDYATIYHSRFQVLKTAFQRSEHKASEEYQKFLEDTAYWIEDYSLYMAVKEAFDNQPWQQWEEEIRFHQPEAVENYRKKFSDEIEFWKFCQFKFREQWMKLKAYANEQEIKIIGDIPLYVAMDSSDVWVHSEYFELDAMRREINIAGVPPDMFSETGQRWGNPIYDWKAMEEDDFSWWRERMKANAGFYDIIRIDHFIGIVNYWSIPAECPTAMDGEWKKGPGEKLTNVIFESIGQAGIIAEDLGVLTKPVIDLIQKTGFPGMKIIEFGLDGPADNPYLPSNYTTSNIIAYIGTHDNETLVGYLNGRNKKQRQFIRKYYGVRTSKELPDVIIRSLFSCIADVVMIQMQDLLKLDNAARTNFPSTVGCNWRWRMTEEQYKEIDTEYYRTLCEIYNRIELEKEGQERKSDE